MHYTHMYIYIYIHTIMTSPAPTPCRPMPFVAPNIKKYKFLYIQRAIYLKSNLLLLFLLLFLTILTIYLYYYVAPNDMWGSDYKQPGWSSAFFSYLVFLFAYCSFYSFLRIQVLQHSYGDFTTMSPTMISKRKHWD